MRSSKTVFLTYFFIVLAIMQFTFFDPVLGPFLEYFYQKDSTYTGIVLSIYSLTYIISCPIVNKI
jgi:hypothetical protein